MVGLNIVKNVVRLTLFYIIVFLFFLSAGAGVSTLRAWIDGALGLPPRSIPFYQTIVYFIGAALPAAVYGASLLVVPSAGRRGRGPLMTGFVILILSTGMLVGVTYGADILRRATVPAPRELTMRTFGESGLIMDYADASLLYLSEPADGAGKAVIAVAGTPLRVMAAREAQASTQRMAAVSSFSPSLSSPNTFVSLDRAFSGTARRLTMANQENILFLVAYSAAIALLLASFSPFAGATRWPLADLALGALFYRGVLEAESAASSGPIIRFASGLKLGIPEPYLAPAMLAALGAFVVLVGVLTRLLRGKKEELDA